MPDSPFKTLGDLIAHAKANPGKLNYPSSGIGTVHHLSGELFNALAGTDLTHIPYRGGNAPLTETLAGRADVLFEAMTLSIGQIQAGKLRALAVTSRERWKALPDTPTAQETLPGYRSHLVHRPGRHRRHAGADRGAAERGGAQGRSRIPTPTSASSSWAASRAPRARRRCAASSPRRSRSGSKVVAARNIER